MLAAMRTGGQPLSLIPLKHMLSKVAAKSLVHCKTTWRITESELLAAESGAKMDFSDTAKAQVLSVDQSQQDDRQKVLESAVGTVTALRRLLADYERLQAERNDFERERGRVLLENNKLRKQAKEATDQRELLVRALETLTTRMDAIGASCLEAAKTARAQSFNSAPLVPASEPPNENQNSEPTTSSADVPPQTPNMLNPANWPGAPITAKTELAPAINVQVLSQYMSQ
jgi:hypothetical protein